MTWGECKIIALQKMAALSVSYMAESRDTRPYLEIMTPPANEALLMITAARPLIKVLEIEQQRHSDGQNSRRYDLPALTKDFRRLKDNSVYLERNGVSKKSYDWELEAGTVLVLPNESGLWRAYYEAYPRLLSEESRDTDVIDLPEDAASLLPLYIASQLFKDDDLNQAVQMRNEFELGLSRLAAMTEASVSDSFVSSRGWY